MTTEETALIHVNPDADLRVSALYQEGLKLQMYAETRTIISDADVKTATDDLSIIAGLKKAIEEHRKKYVEPINGHLRAVNDAFKRFTEPLVQADSISRRKIMEYRSEQQRVRQEQERINRLREEAAQAEMRLKGEISEPVKLMEVTEAAPSRYLTDTGTLGTAKVWKFEVVDFASLPDDYKLPDMVKIRKVVTAGATIPGVKAWQDETLRVTPR